MIVAKDLTRKYGAFTAVETVSFEIPDGQIVGLLGHNGAGKTTIMKMLTGFLEPTSGSVTIDGHDVETRQQRRPGADRLSAGKLPALSGNDRHRLPRLCRRIARRARPATGRRACATRSPRRSWARRRPRPISSLSRGYRQRVGVAQAILHKPKIIILDEPTNGLDPSQIKMMRALIKRLAESATVMLSTHILQEVQAVADRAIVIHRGKLALDSALSDLRKGGRLRLVTNGAPDVVEPLLGALTTIQGFERLAVSGQGHATASS